MQGGFIAIKCAAIPATRPPAAEYRKYLAPSSVATRIFRIPTKRTYNQRQSGRFEVANGGTIFLDELGDIPTEAQVALLRVLQEREFERVGGTHPIPIDVRVIAATHRDLRSAVASGAFRQDLLYRLNVFPLQMPSLRERRADIPLLVSHFIGRHAATSGKRIRSIERRTLSWLQDYDWPG